MPWKLEKSGDKYNVVSQKSGKVVGHKLSKKRAAAMMRALYANVPDATTNASGYPKDVDMKVAKKVDLIVLPVPGTNCGNCKFLTKTKDGLFCNNKKVKQPVTKKMCCSLWDRDDVKRPWGKESSSIANSEKKQMTRIQKRKHFVERILRAGYPKEDEDVLKNMRLDDLAKLCQNMWSAAAREAAIMRRREMAQASRQEESEQRVKAAKGKILRSPLPKQRNKRRTQADRDKSKKDRKESRLHWKAILGR